MSDRRPPPWPDRFDLYEQAAQAPTDMTAFLRAAHGGAARSLREDFCGSGAILRAWLATGGEGRRTSTGVGVDRDAKALAALRSRLEPTLRDRITLRRSDVMDADDRADIIAALNFPLGYFHTRPALVEYLRHARSCLNPRGVFVADTYGGTNAFAPGRYEMRLPGNVRYAWEQREADPLTGRVLNAMHFEVERGGRRRVLRDAFVYDWRLWSVPELKDALAEAGFRRADVYDALAEAKRRDRRGERALARPIPDGRALPDNFVVYVVGRR